MCPHLLHAYIHTTVRSIYVVVVVISRAYATQDSRQGCGAALNTTHPREGRIIYKLFTDSSLFSEGIEWVSSKEFHTAGPTREKCEKKCNCYFDSNSEGDCQLFRGNFQLVVDYAQIPMYFPLYYFFIWVLLDIYQMFCRCLANISVVTTIYIYSVSIE